MEIITEPIVIDDKGLAVRLIKEGEKYIVQQSPLNDEGSFDNTEFQLFGGSVGYSTSEFDNEADAKEFLDDVTTLSSNKLSEKYPDIWVK